MTASPPAPHEPEVELLAAAARRFLWLLRRVFWVAGAVAIGFGLLARHQDGQLYFTGIAGLGTVPEPLGFVWIGAGLPLVLSVRWTLGRRWWLPLPFFVALWFLPALADDDPDHGYILRLFATLVAYLVLLVWRTLWRLTREGGG